MAAGHKLLRIIKDMSQNIAENSAENIAENNAEGNLPALPTTAAQLLALLQQIGIDYRLYQHQPVFTVAESLEIERDMPGAHCRNLFVRDKKENMYLVVAQNETRIDMKKLSDLLGCGRLSFGSAERLWQYLGVRPGSVCPFAIINDKDKAVTIILDAAMMQNAIVNYHPMENHMTVGLAPADLMRFIEHSGHVPRLMDLAPAAPDAPDV